MAGPQAGPLCVFCRRKPIDPAWRPFCSERCKIQDLARWADGSYRVPGAAEDERRDDDDDDETNLWPTR
ncbi:MAG: DNA gyrase inhibitor YacG [Betaproteobacteria bacterium]